MDRRHFLCGTLALSLPTSFSRAQVSRKLGAIEVTGLSDGNLVLPGAFFFADLPQEEVRGILESHGVSHEELRPPCNITMLKDGSRTVLFDAGAGTGFMPSAGLLLDSLDAAGISPDEVTHIVFTHAHPDHLWGVLDDFDDLVFPNASYLIGQAEWDYWRDPNTVSSIGEARASFAVGARRRLDAIEERCSVFSGGQEVLPGVLAHASFGHTPGHMSFEIRAGGEALFITGDAIGNAHVAFERPDWPSGADQDTGEAAKTRMRLLDMLATDRLAMMGFHLPGGGFGRVERKGAAFRFINGADQ